MIYSATNDCQSEFISILTHKKINKVWRNPSDSITIRHLGQSDRISCNSSLDWHANFSCVSKAHSCIDIYSCLHPLSNKRKPMQVPIRRFACCLNMGLNLKILKMSPALFAWRYIRKNETDHFADVFVCENVAYGYDVVKTLWRSKVHSRRHFVQRNHVLENGQFIVLAAFLVRIWLE